MYSNPWIFYMYINRGPLAHLHSLISLKQITVINTVTSTLGNPLLRNDFYLTVTLILANNRKSVGPPGSLTEHVSRYIPRRGKGPVHFPLWPAFPSLYTSTGEFNGTLQIGITDSPFHWLRASLTCLVARILEISAIAHLIAIARCVIVSVGGSNSVIWR